MENIMSEEQEVIEDEVEQDNEEPNEDEVLEGDEKAEEEEVEDDGLTLVFDEDKEEEVPDEAPQWAKDLRVRNREQAKEIRETKKQLKAATTQTEQDQEKLVLGEKPKLEDFGYDGELFEPALLDWHENKKKYEAQVEDAAGVEEKQNKAWNAHVNNYDTQKAEMEKDDFEEIEDVVNNKLSKIQQSIITAGPEKSAALKYSIGKNPKVLDKLAEITDPIKFAVALGRMESQMSKYKGKKPPAPEKRLNGGGASGLGGVQTLATLEKDAEKTGDRSKVHAHKRALKAAAQNAK
jgi:hypothetical protein